MKKKPIKKPKRKDRYPMLGRDMHGRLYRAIANYVDAHGGWITVVGGVEVQQFSGESPGNFRIAVRCTGIAPVFKDGK